MSTTKSMTFACCIRYVNCVPGVTSLVWKTLYWIVFDEIKYIFCIVARRVNIIIVKNRSINLYQPVFYPVQAIPNRWRDEQDSVEGDRARRLQNSPGCKCRDYRLGLKTMNYCLPSWKLTVSYSEHHHRCFDRTLMNFKKKTSMGHNPSLSS